MSAQQPTSLRERQKEDRKARIIAAAKSLFIKSGLEKITIEGIAEIAGVSSVTVHNYYGTKSGVLLALVAESDRELLATFDATLVGKADNLTDLIERFFTLICEHTQTHLDKAIWRQVISASICGVEPRFGKLYHELDNRLASTLIAEIERLKDEGRVPEAVNSTHLGWALFNLQNARFIEFISSDDTDQERCLLNLSHDLGALLPFMA
ncbi:TetR/AcrR family transcriptional regulator [Sinirhodobacter sp. WL0062]|uniref:TetR/AcrR family transcriptional regulator n=1 Tax=Rhodobacter flavimaris TaxID=2907145 RepID=A0ABS8YUG1_9RHOB|nr:TetR/AcrR family transcriptional regulator [Sinirhodobacter sp. WL0062]MCE5972381.1 TetR/AcrR family transcriptional regulator [Sinirhodobacter sp. WL0062]